VQVAPLDRALGDEADVQPFAFVQAPEPRLLELPAPNGKGRLDLGLEAIGLPSDRRTLVGGQASQPAQDRGERPLLPQQLDPDLVQPGGICGLLDLSAGTEPEPLELALDAGCGAQPGPGEPLAIATSWLNETASRTASSASIFRLMVMPAALSPCMNWL